MPENLQTLSQDKETRLTMSWETINDYAGDYIFKIYSGEEASNEHLPATWFHLQAVKENKVIDLQFEKYFMTDPISALLQVEEMGKKYRN